MKDYCEICGTDNNLCYDHNHDTGSYRGTLCSHCNMALGLMKDDIKRLKTAAEYLEERV